MQTTINLSDAAMKRFRNLATKGREAGVAFLLEDMTDEEVLTRFIFAGEAWIEMRIRERGKPKTGIPEFLSQALNEGDGVYRP